MLTGRTYWVALLTVFLGLTVARRLTDRAVELSCWPGGYEKNAWMAYCNSERYGVYDIEAVWHRIEPDVLPAISAAKVMTLSDSRLQNAFSLGGASEWFAAQHLPLYMLGLPTEESGFGERLIDNFHPHPQLVIIDASPYFTGELGSQERPMFSDLAASRKQVLALKDFHREHQAFCARLPWACGHNFAYFRSRVDGHWIFPSSRASIWVGKNSVPNDERRYPVGVKPDESLPLYGKYLAGARRLVEKLNMPPQCIVVTNVPADESLTELPAYIGRNLGVTVIQPRVEGLATFDHAHLTPQDSVRWTRAFLEELNPVLRRCLPDGPPTAGAPMRSS